MLAEHADWLRSSSEVATAAGNHLIGEVPLLHFMLQHLLVHDLLASASNESAPCTLDSASP
jgi:hypothetical protein